jgi:catechol-2,3-dioxygenase
MLSSAPGAADAADCTRRARCDEARMLLNLTHIGQIALPVADVDRSEAFYRNVLGLPKQYRTSRT